MKTDTLPTTPHVSALSQQLALSYASSIDREIRRGATHADLARLMNTSHGTTGRVLNVLYAGRNLKQIRSEVWR